MASPTYPPATADLQDAVKKYSWSQNLTSTELGDAITKARADIELRIPTLTTVTQPTEVINHAWNLCLALATWYAGKPFATDPVTNNIKQEVLDEKAYLDKQIEALAKKAKPEAQIIIEPPE